MRPGVVLLARIYCGVAAAVLIGSGLSAWAAAEDRTTAGVMTFGVGLFVAFGTIAKPTRLLSIVLVCASFAVFAFLAEFLPLLWHDEPPGLAAATRWVLEALAVLSSWRLARPLFAVVTAG